MKLRNSTDIPNEIVRDVIRFTCPSGVQNYDVELRNSEHRYAGRAYCAGSSYHRSYRKFIVLRVGRGTYRRWVSKDEHTGKIVSIFHRPPKEFCDPLASKGYREEVHPMFPFMLSPYQYGQHKGRRYCIATRIEMLVYLAAHELRHLWQAKARNKAGYTWGSRGRYSEVDTEAYAIRKLREWRRSH